MKIIKRIGIITIHKVYNYGSLLQAYAMQYACENLGYNAEVIDYSFPNVYQQNNKFKTSVDALPNEPKWIKILFAKALLSQHKGMDEFVKKHLQLSHRSYSSPDDFLEEQPTYDIFLTGSDQVWNPRHTNGDPTFMLHFVPTDSMRISYAASFGTNEIPFSLQRQYEELLSKYKHISVRENSGAILVKDLTGHKAEVVLDPTLLLNKNEWNQIAAPKRQFNKKYILCYFLNYSFNSFPYVENLARILQEQTGFEMVYVARPPHRLFNKHTHYRVSASPQEFLALIRDAEMILTTSFHGTAFAINYGKPFFTVVENRHARDSRQMSLIQNLGLDKQAIAITDAFPQYTLSEYDVEKEQKILDKFRDKSFQYLSNAINDE